MDSSVVTLPVCPRSLLPWRERNVEGELTLPFFSFLIFAEATSGINGAGTSAQAALGIKDSAAAFFADTKKSVSRASPSFNRRDSN